MEYLIEQLKTEGLVVDATETETPVNNTLQILADTLYIKVEIFTQEYRLLLEMEG